MVFFKNVKRAPAAECGEKKVFVTTKAGVKIWLDPYSESSSGPVCLDIPAGRGFMRRLMSRYNCLESHKKFVDVTQVRSMIKYVASVREQQGMKLARAVRLLAAQMMNGFEVVALEKGSCFDQLQALGVHLTINGRAVTIRDLAGEFSYQDDYYFTATKFALLEVLKKYKIPLTLVDQRDRNSVMKIVGGKGDVDMVNYFSGGGYLKNKLTKFWGGVGLDKVRKVSYRDVLNLCGKQIKLVKTRSVKTLNWHNVSKRDDWLDIIEKVISHDFDKSKTEYLKSLMSKSDFKRVRDRLRKLGAFDFMRPRRQVSELVYDALSIELESNYELWMSFIIRGCNNLLRYQGDRFERLIVAYDEISSVSSSNSSGLDYYSPVRKK